MLTIPRLLTPTIVGNHLCNWRSSSKTSIGLVSVAVRRTVWGRHTERGRKSSGRPAFLGVSTRGWRCPVDDARRRAARLQFRDLDEILGCPNTLSISFWRCPLLLPEAPTIRFWVRSRQPRALVAPSTPTRPFGFGAHGDVPIAGRARVYDVRQSRTLRTFASPPLQPLTRLRGPDIAESSRR